MPTRTSATPGAPTWVDLSTSDVPAIRTFYTELFGWTAEEQSGEEYGGYFMFSSGGQPVAGCMPRMGDASPDVWSVYLASEDIEKTLAAAAAEGGTVVVPAMVVGETGTMGFVVDPSGAGIGVWQPGDFFGFPVYAETGAPSWWELMTTDYAAAVRFYRNVFGWETTVMGDSDEFRYTVQTVGENQAAGVMDASGFLPAGVPSFWSVYFAVDDADATSTRAAELGGTVIDAAQDTPYGRLAALGDPTGARFKILGPNLAQTG
jgi:uncharacterized protein